ncbi:MAG: HupE/UreJ family protein [Kastovskya adunca ATA6-11-RM4]|jgi:urease accessory protein|nr:HupE/UreJ family protein [Kastovskya adunca ATA6-11-RM4]
MSHVKSAKLVHSVSAHPGRSPFLKHRQGLGLGIVILVIAGLLCAAPEAIAHHPTGGQVPANFITGFLSGLGHPVVGLDHLAFVIASGLVAIGLTQGLLIPTGFIVATLAGTGIHLLSIDLPSPEIVISFSVVAFGAILAIPTKPNGLVLTVIAAIAGLFHGFAYGESIIGAEMSPLIAYLLGFFIMQYGIALFAFVGGKWALQNFSGKPFSPTQLAGLAISAIGVVFLTSAVIS